MNTIRKYTEGFKSVPKALRVAIVIAALVQLAGFAQLAW